MFHVMVQGKYISKVQVDKVAIGRSRGKDNIDQIRWEQSWIVRFLLVMLVGSDRCSSKSVDKKLTD